MAKEETTTQVPEPAPDAPEGIEHEEEAAQDTEFSEPLEEESEVELLKQELEETRAKEKEYLDGWQRARAELSNARKRFQREQEQAQSNGRSYVLGRLLPVVDDFERALETMPEDLADLDWIKGVHLVEHKLKTILEKEGVTAIEAVGQAFDPMWHEAVTHEPCDDVPEGDVIGEMQKGYKMGERVLRPSMVRVSAGPPPAPEGESEAESKDESPELE